LTPSHLYEVLLRAAVELWWAAQPACVSGGRQVVLQVAWCHINFHRFSLLDFIVLMWLVRPRVTAFLLLFRHPTHINITYFYIKVLINKHFLLTERDSRLAHYFALFWGFGLRLDYLATSGAKFDVIFLLGDTDFL